MGGPDKLPDVPRIGEAMIFRCVMSQAERVDAALCKGDIPEVRARRGAVTCSPQCSQERRRQLRLQLARRKCRYCGRPLRRSAG